MASLALCPQTRKVFLHIVDLVNGLHANLRLFCLVVLADGGFALFLVKRDSALVCETLGLVRHEL